MSLPKENLSHFPLGRGFPHQQQVPSCHLHTGAFFRFTNSHPECFGCKRTDWPQPLDFNSIVILQLTVPGQLGADLIFQLVDAAGELLAAVLIRTVGIQVGQQPSQFSNIGRQFLKTMECTNYCTPSIPYYVEIISQSQLGCSPSSAHCTGRKCFWGDGHHKKIKLTLKSAFCNREKKKNKSKWQWLSISDQ